MRLVYNNERRVFLVAFSFMLQTIPLARRLLYTGCTQSKTVSKPLNRFFSNLMEDPTTMGRDKPTQAASSKMSAAEFKLYNHMAEHMNYFHDNFRSQWKLLYQSASSGQRPLGMSIRELLNVGSTFISHLTMHHNIEEMHIFPVLAEKMPAFQEELQMKTQHKEIHKGLDVMGDYIGKVKSGEEELRYDELKRIMDGFGQVLWEHLDAEVKELGAENMKKYWSKEEMQRMPM